MERQKDKRWAFDFGGGLGFFFLVVEEVVSAWLQQAIDESFLALFPLWLRPWNQVGEMNCRETAIMKDLAAALALMTLNKESYLKNKALPHQEARDRVEVFQSPSSVNCCLHKLTAAVPAWRAPSKMNFFWSSCNMGSAPCSNPLYVQSQTSQVSTWCILEPKYRANLKGTTGTISELELSFWSAARNVCHSSLRARTE